MKIFITIAMLLLGTYGRSQKIHDQKNDVIAYLDSSGAIRGVDNNIIFNMDAKGNLWQPITSSDTSGKIFVVDSVNNGNLQNGKFSVSGTTLFSSVSDSLFDINGNWIGRLSKGTIYDLKDQVILTSYDIDSRLILAFYLLVFKDN